MSTNIAYGKILRVIKRPSSRKLSVYSNLANKRRTRKDLAARKKAEYLATLPKHPLKRLLYRLHPVRLYHYWFSKKGALMLAKIAGVGVILLVLLIGGLFAYYRKDLDSIRPDQLAQRVQTTVTRYYDRRGPAAAPASLLWEDKGDGDYKLVVKSDEISQYMKDATVAIEDKDFYNHHGVSVSGVLRALVNNAQGGSTQGGSTLTQQLVKQVFFADEAQQRGISGIPRKIKELILSIEVERMYDKDQILTLYLNESPYGGRRNGVESAAQTYFGKDVHAKDLTLAQASILAAIPNQPGLYDPYNIPGNQALIDRQHEVLDNMVSQGMVTKQQADDAKKVDILDTIQPQATQYDGIKAAHFVQMVRGELESELGKATVGKGGLSVTTTLDPGIQTQLETSFNEMFDPQNPKYKGIPETAGFDNGAATVEDSQTGQILALMGSRKYEYPGYGQDNAATAFIQPGSTVKPFVYAKLFSDQGDPAKNIYGSGTILPDIKTTFDGGYSPNDADKQFKGNIPIRSSLALSRNIPAIRSMSITGVQPTLKMVRDSGDTEYCTQGADATVGLASAIGGCGTRQVDHVNAFATLARNGVYKPTAMVLEVKNVQGQLLKSWKDDQAKKIIDPQVTYILDDILGDDNARAGLYGRNFPGLVVDKGKVKTASKTGTSDLDGKSKDIWMMSYSPAITMGVWLGNNTPIALKNGNSSLPGTIINEVMTYAHEQDYQPQGKWKPGDWFTQPTGIQKIGNELYPSWYNKNAAQQLTKQDFDKVSKKKATSCTPPAAVVQISVIKTTDPITKKDIFVASDGYDASKDDDVHKCDDAKPGITGINVSKISGSTYRITVSVTAGTNTLSQLDVKVGGTLVNSLPISSAGDYATTYTATSTDPQTVDAIVTDSVFYTGESTQTFVPN